MNSEMKLRKHQLDFVAPETTLKTMRIDCKNLLPFSLFFREALFKDQKERYIQYLAEQNQDLRLTSDAMKLVLEDFMAQMKDLKAQVYNFEVL